MKTYFVYILMNKSNSVCYTGVTNDLIKRTWEHRNNFESDSFTARYNITKLVYFEEYSRIQEAIEREKQIKGWKRDKKNQLIERNNPDKMDLYETIL